MFEILVYRWIRKNEDELVVKLNKDNKKDVQKWVNFLLRFLKRSGILDHNDVMIFDGVKLSKTEFRKKWRKTTEHIRNLAGVLVLALANLFVFHDSTVLFVWLTVIFIILAAAAFVLLLIYYFLIENLHLVNLSLQSLVVSGRLIRRKEVSPEEE